MKKKPLKVMIPFIISIVLVVITGFFMLKVLLNHFFVVAYASETYAAPVQEFETMFNHPERYLPYYNLGNCYYQGGDYSTAAAYYYQALSYEDIPQDRDIPIRINLALALCYSIDFDNLKSDTDIQSALQVLYTARDILMEKGYANDEGTGTDATAQQLKEDIDKMIEKLQQQQNSNDDSNDQEQQQQQEQQEEQDQDDQQKQEQPQPMTQEEIQEIQDNRTKSASERVEEQEYYGKYDENGEETAGGSGPEHPW